MEASTEVRASIMLTSMTEFSIAVIAGDGVGQEVVPEAIRVLDHITLNGLLLPIRRGFDQYANVRPAILYPGVPCPLAGRAGGSIDMVVVRENTEGEYAQVGGCLYHNQPDA